MPNPYLTLVESWKELPPGVGWSKPDPIDGEMSILAPLELAGVTVGAFALRATCNVERPDRDVMLQLETGVPGDRTRLPLCRIDWRPLSGGHKQPKKPGSKRRAILRGSHFHPFRSNWHEEEERMIGSNLPWAQRLEPDPDDLRGLLDLAENLFRIKGLGQIGTPEWAPKW